MFEDIASESPALTSMILFIFSILCVIATVIIIRWVLSISVISGELKKQTELLRALVRDKQK